MLNWRLFFARSLAVGIASLIASQAAAAATYRYVGQPFTDYPTLNGVPDPFSCPPVCSITGSFTVAEPLLPDMAFGVISVEAFSFSDGFHSLTNVADRSIAISTDHGGNIVSWRVAVLDSSVVLGTVNAVFTGPFGPIVEIADISAIEVPNVVTIGENFGSPGTWSCISGCTVPKLTLTLDHTSVQPYIPSSSQVPVPFGPSQPITIEAALTPVPAKPQQVTFTIGYQTGTGGHFHTNATSSALNNYTFVDGLGTPLTSRSCMTNSSTGTCHVLLITGGPGCGGSQNEIPSPPHLPKVSNGWCEVAGQYAVNASSAGSNAKPVVITVANASLSSLPLSGTHYTAAVNPTNHSAFNGAALNMVPKVRCLADQFWEKSGHFVLSFNDLSLPTGGLYDFQQDWHTPHAFHRLGRSVDLNNDLSGAHATNSDTNAPLIFQVDTLGYVTDSDLKAAAAFCRLFQIPEGGPIHFELSPVIF